MRLLALLLVVPALLGARIDAVSPAGDWLYVSATIAADEEVVASAAHGTAISITDHPARDGQAVSAFAR